MPVKPKPLWRCPKCGAKLVTANMWHSCGRFSLPALFARSELSLLPVFRKFATLVRRCGTVTMIPQKTRVTFMARVRFVSVYPRRDHFVAVFIVGRRLKSTRFSEVEKFSPELFGHSVKISSAADLNATLLGWLRESYHYYGQRERLADTNSRRGR